MIEEIECVSSKLKFRRSVIENFRPMEKSTCVRPKPGIAFRPSVPWRFSATGVAASNAAGIQSHSTRAHLPRLKGSIPALGNRSKNLRALRAVQIKRLAGHKIRTNVS